MLFINLKTQFIRQRIIAACICAGCAFLCVYLTSWLVYDEPIWPYSALAGMCAFIIGILFSYRLLIKKQTLPNTLWIGYATALLSLMLGILVIYIPLLIVTFELKLLIIIVLGALVFFGLPAFIFTTIVCLFIYFYRSRR